MDVNMDVERLESISVCIAGVGQEHGNPSGICFSSSSFFFQLCVDLAILFSVCDYEKLCLLLRALGFLFREFLFLTWKFDSLNSSYGRGLRARLERAVKGVLSRCRLCLLVKMKFLPFRQRWCLGCSRFSTKFLVSQLEKRVCSSRHHIVHREACN